MPTAKAQKGGKELHFPGNVMIREAREADHKYITITLDARHVPQVTVLFNEDQFGIHFVPDRYGQVILKDVPQKAEVGKPPLSPKDVPQSLYSVKKMGSTTVVFEA